MSADSPLLDLNQPVGGEFGITAELPTLELIHRFREGQFPLNYGYYRHVDHPKLKGAQDTLAAHCGVPHARLFCSAHAALYELLRLLAHERKGRRVVVLHSGELAPEWHERLALVQAECVFLRLDAEPLPDPTEWSRHDLLLLLHQGGTPETLPLSEVGRGTLLVCSDALPPSLENHPHVKYWTAPVSNAQGEEIGGVVLGKVDRVMSELHELRKQRGAILSTRLADQADPGHPNSNTAGPASASAAAVSSKLCRVFSEMDSADDALLYPSGMAAITMVLDALRTIEQPKMIMIGTLYTDTYGLLRNSVLDGQTLDWEWVGVGDLERLEQAMDERTALVFTETITNPLGDVSDLRAVSELTRRHGVPFVVDNTLATPFNSQPLECGADLVVYSTAKHFSGNNAHRGGVTLFREGGLANTLRRQQRLLDLELCDPEAATLLECLADFPERMERFNANGLRMAEFLRQHPAVQDVYFPGLADHPSHAVSQRLLQGTGSVVSWTLRHDHPDSFRAVYDGAWGPIRKAPTLGSNTTLLCPYALVAHYHATDEELLDLGFPRTLLRIAVGCEPQLDEVLAGLDASLNRAFPPA
ncbi:MAG: aminotransferase class I/II-fold pyridoxal phosphate-dependent enzyme [SAR324 cluster bacterium]|nr:aminotransferase class I/II-fold pyridoxal phosphate-dependent enzyme [SAR324 cluster bacterium]